MPQDDYGTMGNVLAASRSSDSSSDSGSDSTTAITDTDTVKRTVAANKIARQDIQGRLHELDERSDALRPPTLEQPPPSPQAQQTPPEQRWGSFAMMLAAFSGALTRAPLTTSLNAMAAVNNAFNAGDHEATQQAMEEWKIANANAEKMNQFTMQAYSDGLRKLQSDRYGALAELRYTSAALKDDVVSALFDAGHDDQAIAILTGKAAATQHMSEAAQKYAYAQAAMSEWQEQFTQQNGRRPTAQENSDHYNALIKQSDTEKPEQPGVYEENLEKQYVTEQTAAFKADPANAGKEPTAAQVIAWKHEAAAKGKPESAAAATGSRYERLAQSDFLRDVGRDPDLSNQADRDKVDRYIQDEMAKERRAGSNPSAASVTNQRFEELATADFRNQFHRDPDPSNQADKEKLDRFVLDEQAKAKLAASPFMHNLNNMEAQAVRGYLAEHPEVDANDPAVMGQIVRNVTGRNILTPAQQNALEDHALSVSHALDAMQKMRDAMNKAAGVAGGLGRPLRAGETVGNILGYLSDTDRADFRAAQSYVQYELPDLLNLDRRTSLRLTGAVPPPVSDMVGNQRWGDTYQNLNSRLDDLQSFLVQDLRQVNRQYQSSTGKPLGMFQQQGGAAPSQAQADAPAATHKEGDKSTSKSGKPIIFRNGGWEYE